MTIEGENFGSTRRNVYLIMGGEGYECQVNTWSQTRISVTIPASMANLVGETARNAEICVVMRRYSHPIRITPDPAMLSAQIEDLSNNTITPGQTLVIEGDHFLTQRPGTVTFSFSGQNFDGRIDEWADDYVVVTLPGDIEGLQQVSGIVNLRNHAGHEDTKSLTFEPIIVTKTFRAPDDHVAYAFIFGEQYTWEENKFSITNGWTVLYSRLDTTYTAAHGG